MRWTPASGILICVSSIALGSDPEPPPLTEDPAAVAGGDFVEVDAAKRRVADLITGEADTLEIAAALTELANAQRLSGDLPAAAQNYGEAISRIQTAEDMLSSSLVPPLVGMGQSLATAGSYGLAMTAFERAAHITRVNKGPMNLEQCDILGEMIQLEKDLENYKEAAGLQQHQLQLYRRALEETDPVVIDAWRRMGELLALSGDHHNAQEMYVFAADLVRVADGQDSLSQIPLLTDLSESYLHHAVAERFTRIEMARAELDRIVSITESNEDATPQQRADAYLRLGDFMQRYGDYNSAIYNYRRAWQTLPDDESRNEAFGRPWLLNRLALTSSATDSALAASQTSKVRVVFDVNRHGSTENESVAEEHAETKAGKRAVSVSRKLIFRPRFEAGDPVLTDDVAETVEVDTN